MCCRNSPLSPPRCLARGSDPLGASSPWDLAPESLSPTGQGLGTAAAPGMSATTDPRLRERHLRCPQCCGKLKCRPKPRPPAFPQHWFQELQVFLRKAKKLTKSSLPIFRFSQKRSPTPAEGASGAGKQVRCALLLFCTLTAVFCSLALLESSPATLGCRMQHNAMFAACLLAGTRCICVAAELCRNAAPTVSNSRC
jgi:hypothetical protein